MLTTNDKLNALGKTLDILEYVTLGLDCSIPWVVLILGILGALSVLPIPPAITYALIGISCAGIVLLLQKLAMIKLRIKNTAISLLAESAIPVLMLIAGSLALTTSLIHLPHSYAWFLIGAGSSGTLSFISMHLIRKHHLNEEDFKRSWITL